MHCAPRAQRAGVVKAAHVAGQFAAIDTHAPVVTQYWQKADCAHSAGNSAAQPPRGGEGTHAAADAKGTHALAWGHRTQVAAAMVHAAGERDAHDGSHATVASTQ